MANNLAGKHVSLRTRKMQDSRFVYDLRNTHGLASYLNNTSIWTHVNFELKRLVKSDYNFILLNLAKQRIGSISLYDIDTCKKEAEWGRWISIGNPRQNVESMFLLLKFSFELLAMKTVFCRTNFNNTRIVNFHARLPYSSSERIVHNGVHFVKDTLNSRDWDMFKSKLEAII